MENDAVNKRWKMSLQETVRNRVHHPAVLLVPVTLAFLAMTIVLSDPKLIVIAVLLNVMAAIISIAPTQSSGSLSKIVIPIGIAFLFFVVGVLLLWPMEHVLSMVTGVFVISLGLFSISLSVDVGRYSVHIHAALSIFCAVLTLIVVIAQGGLLGVVGYGFITVLLIGETIRTYYKSDNQ